MFPRHSENSFRKQYLFPRYIAIILQKYWRCAWNVCGMFMECLRTVHITFMKRLQNVHKMIMKRSWKGHGMFMNCS